MFPKEFNLDFYLLFIHLFIYTCTYLISIYTSIVGQAISTLWDIIKNYILSFHIIIIILTHMPISIPNILRITIHLH